MSYTKLALLFCILLNITNTYAQTVCQPTQSGVDPSSLPQIPDFFETRIEASFITLEKTEEIVVLYNNIARRAELIRLDRNQRVRKLFFYDTNEFFTFTDFSCSVQPLNTTAGNEFFGIISIPGTDMSTMKPPNQLFYFGNGFPVEKLADDVKRGITVTHYRSCQSLPNQNSNLLIDFYFRSKTFGAPIVFDDAYKELPITITVTGYIEGQKIDIEYNFYEFSTLIDRAPELTSLPSLPFCSGQTNKQRPPSIPDTFTFTQRFISFSRDRSQVVRTFRTAYSYSAKLVRYDFNFPPIESGGKAIEDYNSGVGYVIDKNFGNCSMYPLGTFYEFDAIQNDKNSDNPILTFKTPDQFFNIDDSYFYSGQRMHRGIKCDVFISNRTDVYFMDLPVQPAYSIVEILFSSRDSFIESSDKSEGTVPISALVTAANFSRVIEVDYFDFDSNIGSASIFDVSQCFKAKEKIEFAIKFAYPEGITEDTFNYYFKSLIYSGFYNPMLSILQPYRVSPLRVIPPKIVPQRRNLIVYTGILNSPPAKYHFTMLENKTINIDAAQFKIQSYSGDECASICLNDSRINSVVYECLSFDVCQNPNDPNSVICSFYNFTYVTDPNIVVQGSSICSHYKKNVENLDGAVTDELYRAVESNVLKNRFNIDIYDDKGSLITRFPAVDIFQSTLGATAESIGTSSFETSTFFKQFGQFGENIDFDEDAFTKNPQYQLRKREGVSIEECARLCIYEPRFVCESFSYDPGMVLCKWTSLSTYTTREGMIDGVKYIINSEKFLIYSKDPLYDYFEYPFKIATNTNFKEIVVKSATECAFFCTTDSTIKCRSFNLCDLDDSKKCLLSESHIHTENNPNVATTALCSHFSRNSISDFKLVPNSQLSVLPQRTYFNSSVRECADTCSFMDSFFCRSFDFFSDRTCLLYLENVIDQAVADIKIKPNPESNHYSRVYFNENGVQIDVQIITGKKGGNKYSTGTIAGVSIALIIVGLVVGAGIAFGYLKFFKKSTDLPSMEYVNPNYKK